MCPTRCVVVAEGPPAASGEEASPSATPTPRAAAAFAAITYVLPSSSARCLLAGMDTRTSAFARRFRTCACVRMARATRSAAAP